MQVATILVVFVCIGVNRRIKRHGVGRREVAMKTRVECAALLLLVVALFNSAAAQGEVTASGDKHGGGPPPPTQCRFGWVPVTFDSEPWKNLDIKRRPKLLNYRCKEACESMGLRPVLTQDAEKPKPLCALIARRQLGAQYTIYGSWYEGEAGDDYESTCRGRDERGARYQEWATRWNTTTEAWQFGFQCGCSGCVQGCHNADIAGPSFREDVLNPDGNISVNTGAFVCEGSLKPWGKDNKVMQQTPPGNPNDTCPALTPQAGAPPNMRNTPWSFPYPICEGKTAAFGWQWGTRLPDGTCTTFDALVADVPEAFCTANATLLPKAPTGFPWIVQPKAMSAEEETMSVGRLDLLLGLQSPVIPAELAANRGPKSNTP